MNVTAILTVSLILFSVIDIIGSLPVIINMKKEGLVIKPSLATGSAGLIMIAFLFFGAAILGIFGIEVASFALAGSLIIFFIGLEMIGAGTLTTIISLKAEYDTMTIICGIAVNLIFIYFVLRSTDWLGQKIPPSVMASMRKVFGILLIAIAIQMARQYLI